MQRHETRLQALLSMPDMTLQQLAMRMQTALVPLNMQAKEMVDGLAQGAMRAGNDPRPEFKDITDQEKQDGLIFMSQAAWNEFVTKTVMMGAAILWVLSRFES